jgi:hypothetical protein
VEVSTLTGGGQDVLYVRHPSSASLLLYLDPSDRRKPITEKEAQRWAAAIPEGFRRRSRDPRFTDAAKAAAAEAYQDTARLEVLA